ncbi:hypothetical protein FRB95_012455 [Tulasnella sp. JGI-2019a]|nr:hypothetical protein FRB95_012455 [Tulasnella sp. JGI-2019a]
MSETTALPCSYNHIVPQLHPIQCIDSQVSIPSEFNACPSLANIHIPEPTRSYSGGFGELVQGYHIKSRCKLAMKRIKVHGRSSEVDATMRRRLSREARIWCSLLHINILPFCGVAVISNIAYLVSPWMDHGDLSYFVASRRLFLDMPPSGRDEMHPMAVAYRKFREHAAIAGLALGLDYLHAHHVIHGDLKAANVVLDDTLQPKICDFGLTKVIYTEYARTSETLKGAGSHRWMAPELFTEDENSSKTIESDVYAFGMTIAEILSAELPFPHLRHSWRIALDVVKGVRPIPEPMSRAGKPFNDLWDLAALCWDPDPSLRPLAGAIVAVLDGGE